MYGQFDGRAGWRVRLAVLLSILVVLLAVPTAAFIWMTSVPGRSYLGAVPRLTKAQEETSARLRRNITAIASEPHNLAHPRAYRAARDYIAAQVRAEGYEPGVQPVIPGADNLWVDIAADSPNAGMLIVGAHYDSAGDAPGANDNGSGTAALLELARALKPHDRRLQKHIRLIWFANEEPPYFQRHGMGSVAAAKVVAASRQPIIGMISLETLGYFDDRRGSQHYPFPLGLRYPDRGNFVAFVGMPGSRSFLRNSISAFRRRGMIPSVGGVAPGAIQGIGWSDHWSFDREGIPAFMITDTAPFRYPWYHTTQDTPDKIDVHRLTLIVDGLRDMLLHLANDAE